MIVPIDDSNVGRAIDLLTHGFAGSKRSFWEGAVARIHSYGENAALDLPIGQLLWDQDRPVGVALTIASRRPQADGSVRTHVNFAGWYIEPEARWRAPVMLRALTRVPCDVLTDLTPAPAVCAMLPAFGFRQITAGVSLNLVGLGAGAAGAVERADGARGGPVYDMLAAHAPFGAIPAVLRGADGVETPLLFKVTRWRNIPTARVLYCGANTHMLAHLGAVAGFLRRQGAVLFKLDAPFGARAPGWFRPGREIKFVRGEISPDTIDFAGSELALLDL